MTQHLAIVAILVPSYDAGRGFCVGNMGFDPLDDTDIGSGSHRAAFGSKRAHKPKSADPGQG